MFNLMDRTSPLGGHLFVKELASIWFVSKPFFGKESHSVQFFDITGKQMFAIYLGRDEKREIILQVKQGYDALRGRYRDAHIAGCPGHAGPAAGPHEGGKA